MILRSILVLSLFHAVSPFTVAQEAQTEPDTIIVTAGKDPVIAAIRVDALDHRRKVVAQTCLVTTTDKDGTRKQTRQYVTEGATPFIWLISDYQIDGKPASDKEMKKSQKRLDKYNAKRTEEDDERYSIFAELIAEDDQIERLSPQDGMRRYRIKRLPKRLSKDMPDAIAKRLKPVIWVADPEGMPFVKRLEISLSDIRMYVVAKIKSAHMDIYFDRREDGYVKERDIQFDFEYSFFGSDRFNRGTITCDVGGPVVTRKNAATGSGSPVSP